MAYPKPEGWNGGPDGTILRTGSAGRLGLNAEIDEGAFDAAYASRCNEHTIDFFDGGA